MAHASIASAEIQPDGVVVVFGTPQAAVTLPHLWLRDNCDCSECRVEQTEEKKFHLAQVAMSLMPESAIARDGVLHLRWPDGHETTYRTEHIVDAISGRPDVPLRHWDSEFSPTRVDHAAFFNEPTEAIRAIEDFLATGVLVVTGAPTEPDSLEQYADRLGPMREMHFARIHNVEVDPRGYNVAHTNLGVPPHNDFAGMSWPPSIQCLHMLANRCEGGQSVVVDGFAALEQMRIESPQLFDALCTVEVPFRMFNDTTDTYAVSPLVELEPRGRIRRFRYSNQVMQPIDPTQPGVTDFYRAYHDLSTRIIDEANQARFRLEGGHVLIVASHRILHARDSFVANEVRHLQDAYFEHDNLRNALWVLKRDQALQASA